MSPSRPQDRLNQLEPDQTHRPRPAELPPHGGTVAQRLSQSVLRLRHDPAALLIALRALPPVQRLTARVVLIRDLGSGPGQDLCDRAFGPGQARFPVTADASPAPLPPGPWHLYAASLQQGRDDLLTAVRELGRPAGTTPAAPLLSAPLLRAAERRAGTLYRRAAGCATEADPDHAAVQQALSRIGAGAPLPQPLRAELEERLGLELSAVRVHTDSLADAAAQALQASAFTIGEDIFFRRGAYDPGAPAGKELLLHELAHVRQWSQGRVQATGAPGALQISQPGDALELEADRVAQAALAREPRAPRAPRRAPHREPAARPAVSAATAHVLPRHLSIKESVTEYQKQINPAASVGPSITDSGQFYWSKLLAGALIDTVRAYYMSSGLGLYYKRWWTAQTTRVGTGKLDQDARAMQDAVFGYDDATYHSFHKQLVSFTTGSSDKAEFEVKALAALLGPPAGSAGALYQTYWAGYLLSGTVFNFKAPANKAHLTYATLLALHHQKEAGACGETAGMLANHFTGAKKGFSALDPDKKRASAKSFSQGITTGTKRDPASPRRGDVATYVPLSGVIAKLKAALDDGFVFVARVYSGLLANDMPGGDGFEHSITIIGYDGDKFVFWDPDAGASIGVEGQAGFGLLHYDSSKNRLTTAKSDADMEVDAHGAHASGQHRYQPGSLIGK